MKREWLYARPENRKQLKAWVYNATGLILPEAGVCEGHCSPLDYLAYVFFEQGEAGDAVVWAPRGGGKTAMGAAATLLDMLFKPGIQIRIIGGSLEQSQKMYAYLRGMVEGRFDAQLAKPATVRGMEFRNGSRVEILAQSQTAVRGQRVQKLRCDEVDLFDRGVWEAAQMTTRSDRKKGKTAARGTVEAFSTMHVPGGLMEEIVGRAEAAGKKVFRWCAWDVQGWCKKTGAGCAACSLHDGCQGKGRERRGHMQPADLRATRARVSEEAWARELCCERPRRENVVFAGFERGRHVRSVAEGEMGRRVCGVDFGFAGAFVCVWLAVRREGELWRVHVYDELVKSRQRLAENVAEMKARSQGKWPTVVHVDPAGAAANGQSGVSDIRVLKDAGFAVRSRGGGILAGLEMMQALVSPACGETRWSVDGKCEAVISALENYAWTSAQSSSPLKDGVHDHVIDALRYAVAGEMKPAGKLIVRFY